MRLGIFEPSAPHEVEEQRGRLGEGEQLKVHLLGRTIPVLRMAKGLRAVEKDRPARPGSVEHYLEGKFGDGLDEVRQALEGLARSLPPAELARRGFALYERFRPAVPAGERGWGVMGMLELEAITSAAEDA